MKMQSTSCKMEYSNHAQNKGDARPHFPELRAGCSAFSWETLSGEHLWGRNFDFNRMAAGSSITYLPAGLSYYTAGCTYDNNLKDENKVTGRYAALGTGATVLPSTPTLFEGINEMGLMGGQLYYRKFASYPERETDGRLPLQPAFAVTYLLTQCASVDEVVRALTQHCFLTSERLLGTLPTVHWIFSDRSGETVIIEPDAEGLHIYRNSMGVLTNSPSYPWHRENLLNYPQLRTEDYENISINGETIAQCFSGTGGSGLPGSCTSTDRFVRLAFLKQHACKGQCEEEGVACMLRLFENISFPLGAVRVSETEQAGAKDEGIVPYDYTLYTSVMCSESGKFYFTTYRNPQIRCIDLNAIKHLTKIRQWALEDKPQITILSNNLD